ncbi:hypothetical protein [Aggregatibacter actinomycetemcomitans]|uniref:hypothetical protein n=1 Tax=Aggregatibacter actinomycetemcomitans TaxID=714 RepID=UPI001E4DB8C9|nr:hypothetical protein [Aggregatibacter actinomycetemcomitans]
MEEYAKLLNTILTKVVFNHMTMFFVFLFVGFTFIPTELTLYLNAKTPAFFPDWFTLANFGSLVFGFVATMIWILSSNAIIHADIVRDKAKNGELLEIGKKYYAIKYAKDKVE